MSGGKEFGDSYCIWLTEHEILYGVPAEPSDEERIGKITIILDSHYRLRQPLQGEENPEELKLNAFLRIISLESAIRSEEEAVAAGVTLPGELTQKIDDAVSSYVKDPNSSYYTDKIVSFPLAEDLSLYTSTLEARAENISNQMEGGLS